MCKYATGEKWREEARERERLAIKLAKWGRGSECLTGTVGADNEWWMKSMQSI